MRKAMARVTPTDEDIFLNVSSTHRLMTSTTWVENMKPSVLQHPVILNGANWQIIFIRKKQQYI